MDTWLGKRLSPAQIREVLEESDAPPEAAAADESSHRFWQAMVNLDREVTRARGTGGVSAEWRALFPLVIRRAASPDARVRGAAAWMMGRMPESRETVIPTLHGLLRDADRDVALYAACALANLADGTGREILRGVLADTRADARRLGDAVGALAFVGDASDIPAIEGVRRRAGKEGLDELASFADRCLEILKGRTPATRPG